jgi:hypothetical protein
MPNHRALWAACVTTILAMCFPSSSASAAAIVESATGLNPSDATLLTARDNFRADLGGGTTAGANGSFAGARREINWDTVPAASAAPNGIAANFFNTTSPRGVVFSTPGTGLQVSAATTDGGGQPVNFGNINAAYTSTFQPFSPQRLFTPLGSNVTDVNFFLPGSATPATVTGFGAMFSDVDMVSTTSIQYFNAADASLGTFFVPAGAASSQTLSFLGVSFNAGEQIGRVRITTGNAAPGVNDGGGTDIVVMDDFIYSEPVPEPAAAGLLVAFGAMALRSDRRRRV